MPDGQFAAKTEGVSSARSVNGSHIACHLLSAALNYWSGLTRYSTDFAVSAMISLHCFQQVEARRIPDASMMNALSAYPALSGHIMDLVLRGARGAMHRCFQYADHEYGNLSTALYKSVWMLDPGELSAIAARQDRLMELVAVKYPRAIADIEPEHGFHFERGINPLIAETERFYLYQVMPSRKGITVRENAKPVCLLPPSVLGANILAFLPGEERSYAHCFANQGVPTYVRIYKDIRTTVALQQLKDEDDVRDTAAFCETILKRHGKPVTLNGYCQGGYMALCCLLSGALDGLVDAFITCVSPIDGTRSRSFSGFLKGLPSCFNDLSYDIRTLPNGNQVADGRTLRWVYKLKSIENESPMAAFLGDLLMFARQENGGPEISKTAAALNYWLTYERSDLPLSITRRSFASYNTPIATDGSLPVTLLGRKLNLHRIQEKKIPWLICYGLQDDLVEKESALAPLDYIPVEVAPFPKGHVAIATSWSDPSSAYALHTRFGNSSYRGPVRFHLDMDAELEADASSTPLSKP